MFGKKKPQENRFIVAIKDYSNTLKLLEEGALSLPYNKDIYLKLLKNPELKVDNLKELKKFVRANGKIAGEVMHFWEGLIVEGYTLMNVQYDDKTPSLEHICNKDLIKYVCRV